MEEGIGKVQLQPINDQLGPDKSPALINLHALSNRVRYNGHIQGKGKKGCFKAFLASDPAIIAALSGPGEGPESSDKVIKGCEELLCALFCHITQACDLRWLLFEQLKPDQGVDKLPPTHGVWCLVGTHSTSICAGTLFGHRIFQHPVFIDPLQLGWLQLDGRLLPDLLPASNAVQQLVYSTTVFQKTTHVHVNAHANITI